MTLLTGTLMSMLSVASRGGSRPVRCNVSTPEGMLQAFVKPSQNDDRVLAEVIASMVGIKLGLPVATPIVVKVSDASLGLAPGFHFGSVALPYPDLAQAVQMKGPQAQLRMKKWPHVLDAACFDEWIANSDRHPGNIIFDGRGKYWLIDHDRAMLDQVASDALNQFNRLFELLMKGATDVVVGKLQPKTEAVMASYEVAQLDDVIAECASLFAASNVGHYERFLTSRQAQLVRLGRVRTGQDAKQGRIFDDHF